MKPHWDSLMSEYADSKTVLVADVDCTAGGKSLCEKQNVEGYPTLKYGDPTALQDYAGERDVLALEKFAAENLGPTCGPDNLDLCDAVDKKFIEKFKKWDVDELELAIEEKLPKLEKMAAEAKKITDKKGKEIGNLNDKIEKEEKKKEKAAAKVRKEENYAQMEAVKKHNAAAKKLDAKKMADMYAAINRGAKAKQKAREQSKEKADDDPDLSNEKKEEPDEKKEEL